MLDVFLSSTSKIYVIYEYVWTVVLVCCGIGYVVLDMLLRECYC